MMPNAISRSLKGSLPPVVIAGIAVIVVIGGGMVACSKPPTVKAVKVTRGAVESTVTTIGSGTVEGKQQADLNFGAMGRVARINVATGDKVKRGRILASLENSDLMTIARDTAAEVGRVNELFKSGLVSKVALDDAKRAARVAQANYEKSIIVAPFDGLVTDVNLRQGELAQIPGPAGQPPLRLIDLKQRLVKAEIDELDLGKVSEGQKARIRIPALGRDQIFNATVTKSVPFISSTREQDRTSEIELTFDENDPRIPVGASAEVEIIIETKDDALIVPARVVLGTVQERFTYRVREGRLRKTPVTVGLGNYERREILKGLSVGDVVAYPAEDVEFSDGLKVTVDIQKWP